ncbi:MAG TPA: PAS domain S-box protein [Caulobacteraceae bacterium]|jgi:PAS domain S-box-containing protein
MTAATCIAFGVLASSAWLARANFDQGRRSDSSVEDVHAEQWLSEKLLSSLTDAETGQRGFLLTGDVNYLAPYESSQAEQSAEIAELRKVSQADGETNMRLDRIERLAAAKMSELSETIALAKSGHREAALDIVRTNHGKEIMDAIRVQVVALQARGELVRAHSRLGGRSLWPRIGVVALGALASLLLAGVALGQRRARRAVSASLASLERFTRAFGLSHGLLRTGDGIITFWAEGMERLYGYTTQQAVGKNYRELLKTTFPVPLPEIEAALATDGEWEGELVQRHRDGSLLEVASHWALHRGASGEAGSLIEIDNDVSEARRAQREQERASWLLRTLIEAAPGVIYAKDREGRMILANAGALQLIGKPWSQVEGRTDLENLSDRAQAEIVMANDRRIMEGGQVELLEERVGGDTDNARVWLSTKTPLRGPDGQISGLVGVSIDITEREQRAAELAVLNARLNASLEEQIRVQQALTKSDLEFRTSFEAAAVGKAHFDPASGRIIRANAAFAHMLGYEPDELNGRIGADLTWPEDREAEQATFVRFIASGAASLVREKRYESRDGTPIWARSSSTLIRSPASHEPTLIISVIENIDEAHKGQIALKAAKSELEATVEQRTAALGQRDLLLREVYHRVKNNLQIVDGLLLMQARKLDDAQAKAAISGLRGRIYALGLVHHQLMGSSNLRTFDVSPFLHELTANLLDANGSDDIKISVRSAPLDIGLDFAIPLGLLVTELVTNSLKHAFPGGMGSVDISLDRRDDGTIDLVVSDDGQGYDTGPMRKTSGLGSVIIKGLVSQLEGRMTIDGQAGSRVEIHLAQPGLPS